MFIIDHCCISPQGYFDNLLFNKSIKKCTDQQYIVLEPSYEKLIPNNLLRRMEKDMRIGIGAGISLTKKHLTLDGIILGTATAGLNGGMKFLQQIMEFQENTLTPTSFIQSTPNSIASTIALMSQNTGYNTTYVGEGVAFETALLDAMTMLQKEATSLLVGSVDTISTYNYNINQLAGHYKKENINPTNLFQSNTKGSIAGEGAAMFVVSSNQENAKCEIIDVHQFSCENEKNINQNATDFLNKNNFSLNNIDTLILGLSGDSRYDSWYNTLIKSFPKSNVYTYKNIVGEYPTSSSFATWMASSIIENKKMPNETIYRSKDASPNNILIYNNYLGLQHSLILITSVK